MQIKRFTAETINEALKFVKAEFGGDAVILSTRTIKGRGVEVTAAADREFDGTRSKASDSQRSNSQKNDIQNIVYKKYTPKTINTQHEIQDSRLEAELKELKDMLGTLVSHVKKDDFFDRNKKMAVIQKVIVSNGVDETLSYKMLSFINNKLGPQKNEDEPLILKNLRELIVRYVTTGEIADNGPRPKIVVFVGPTGVGKTTTLAKLAAINSIKKKKKVALVTLDTYRIAAVEQLKVYAKIMGLPVHVAGSPEEFGKLVDGIKGVDLILVDTAGRGQKEKAHMDELHRIFKRGLSMETHLVLSATAKEKDTIDVIRRYRQMPIDRLIFTKIDETTTYGGIFNALIASGRPLSYLTTGQRVPEDIEPATSERIADLIVGTVNSEQ